MKAHNPPLFSDSTLVSVHDSKTFECNDSVFDTAEEKPTMNGNQNGILSHSNGYKEADSLGIPVNDFGNTNVHDNKEDPLACDRKDGNEFWEVPELDDSIFFDNNNEIKASNVRDDHNVDLSKINGDNRGGNPFACDIPSSETNEIVAASVTDDQNGGLSNIIHSKRGGNPFECDTKDRDQPWNIPEYESLGFLDDKENETIDSDSPFTSHSELFDSNKHFYSDKGVTDHELPELTVCYRENNFNMVKDICMDEGVPAVDKVLIESWKDGQPSTSVSVDGMKDGQPSTSVSVDADEEQQSNTRKSVDMGSTIASVSQDSSFKDAKNIAVTHDTEIEATGAPVPNGFNPSLENNANKDADKDSYLEDLLMIFGSKCTTNASEKPSSLNTVVRVEESNIKTSDGDQSTLQPDQVPSEQTLKSQTAVSASGQTNNKGNIKEGVGTSIFDVNLTKPESTKTTEGGVGNLPEDSHMPKAVSVHKNGNSDNNSASSQVPFANTADNAHQQHLESQNMANGQSHFADGEASFSAARGPISGSITYSGPISYSGSVSLRSESSTTSTRSFAFPVLQNEWNSSPVRMAKAERRRLSKQKGWKQGILCCRF
uniref:18S pre-ribosomal assembly protein gar2-related n=2 Tax=Solanum tuberosum TaxID=4113 RepID=M1CEY5_SOLTU